MSVRSIRLAAGNIAATESGTLYTVPANRRTILRSANIFTDSGAANHLDLNIYNGATLIAHVRFPLAATGSLDAAAHVWCWIVLNTGDSIKVQAGAATVYYVISGAELVT